MASTARTDELKKKFDENPRRYFAPLANEFRKAGDIEQAIMICEEFLPQQPGHMSGHIVYGQALYEAGRLPESRAVFETALGLDPENLIALRHLGDIAVGQGDQLNARTWYLRVLDADPRNEEIQALIATLSPVAEKIDVADEFAFAPTAEAAIANAPLEIIKEVPAMGEPETPIDDTHPLGMPAIPDTPTVQIPAQRTELIEGFSLHGFESTSTPAGDAAHSTPALGLESTSFTPPEEEIPGADLDDSLDSGVPSFSAPSQPVASIDGLQGIGGVPHDERAESASQASHAPLDLDDGLVLPPQGDALAATASTSAVDEPAQAASADFPDDDAFDRATPHFTDAITEPIPRAQRPDERDEAPMELPPAVIAAEAELIDAGETPAPTYASDAELEAESASAHGAPFVTETMAELYLAQGFREEARSVYVQLLAANPDDSRLQGLVASIAAVPARRQSGANVREFFARMASRRPGMRGAGTTPPAHDDFGAMDSVSAPAAAPVERMPAHDEFEPFAPAPVPEPATWHIPPSEPESENDQWEAAATQQDADTEAAEGSAPEDAPEEQWNPQPSGSETEAAETEGAEGEAEEESTTEASAAELPAAEHTPDQVAPAIERAAAMRTPGGSIDALFGNRQPGTSEDSAASALAQAFGATAATEPQIVGRPARAASAELSLDSVFRDGPARPPRTSQSFSFDQFFSGAASTPAAPAPRTSGEVALPGEPPAERSADDVEQFNSWLQGLKPR